MKFEESIFKGASDLDDYRKTIQKRLKRLQKHYAKQQQAGGGGGNKEGNADLTREKELLLESELRDTYGARLLYIAKHADDAIEGTRNKHGESKAGVLRQHASNAKQWAVHLGLELPAGEKNLFSRQEKRDMEFLNKLKTYLETRVENIRSHIVKIMDADLFLEEALFKIDNSLLQEKVTNVFRNALKGADPDNPEFSEEQMKQLMERMNAPVPIPRRNQEGDRIRAAVARIEKVRAAAQALYTYMGLPLSSKTSFRGSVEKCHSVVIECLNELEGEYNNLVQELGDHNEEGKRIIQLEDAWNNPLQYAELESEETPSIEDVTEEERDLKRQKVEAASYREKVPMVIRSRYLLNPGRNTFSTLVPALKRKGATLVYSGSATLVKLEFGNAFEMTISFVPLLATIRAMPSDTIDNKSSMASLSGGLRWPSLYQGLCPPHIDPSESSGSMSTNKSSLHVLGVIGDYSSVGQILAKKIEYASAQATYVLRRCFAETTVGKSATAKSEFEIEILEAGALIRFLQIARTSWGNWADLDA